jgi:hypothetical protein
MMLVANVRNLLQVFQREISGGARAHIQYPYAKIYGTGTRLYGGH